MDAIRLLLVRHARRTTTEALLPGAFLRRLGIALAIALAVGGSLLLMRRLSGAFERPLSEAAIISLAVTLALWALAARLLLRVEPGGAVEVAWIDWLPTVSLALVGAAISMSGASVAALVLFWSLVAAEEFLAKLLHDAPARRSLVPALKVFTLSWKPAVAVQKASARRRRTASRSTLRLAAPIVGRREATISIPVEKAGHEARPTPLVDEVAEAVLPPGVWHQFRRMACDGVDVVSGALRVAIVPGERMAIAHLVFCPSFGAEPEIEAEPVEGPDCRIRPTHVYSYGARLEVRLSSTTDEAAEVVLAYEARAAAVNRA